LRTDCIGATEEPAGGEGWSHVDSTTRWWSERSSVPGTDRPEQPERWARALLAPRRCHTCCAARYVGERIGARRACPVHRWAASDAGADRSALLRHRREDRWRLYVRPSTLRPA